MTHILWTREDDLREAFPRTWVSFNANFFFWKTSFNFQSIAVLSALSGWSVPVTCCQNLDQKEMKITALTAWRETINIFQKYYHGARGILFLDHLLQLRTCFRHCTACELGESHYSLSLW